MAVTMMNDDIKVDRNVSRTLRRLVRRLPRNAQCPITLDSLRGMPHGHVFLTIEEDTGYVRGFNAVALAEYMSVSGTSRDPVNRRELNRAEVRRLQNQIFAISGRYVPLLDMVFDNVQHWQQERHRLRIANVFVQPLQSHMQTMRDILVGRTTRLELALRNGYFVIRHQLLCAALYNPARAQTSAIQFHDMLFCPVQANYTPLDAYGMELISKFLQMVCVVASRIRDHVLRSRETHEIICDRKCRSARTFYDDEDSVESGTELQLRSLLNMPEGFFQNEWDIINAMQLPGELRAVCHKIQNEQLHAWEIPLEVQKIEDFVTYMHHMTSCQDWLNNGGDDNEDDEDEEDEEDDNEEEEDDNEEEEEDNNGDDNNDGGDNDGDSDSDSDYTPDVEFVDAAGNVVMV